ncbi:hypothetical protein NDU88_003181 [Pleurodeles waltl]|uniref:Uncharacterized protein n=1 Tax=Pleurodeles waltl TaxID=8319 RepID=A0AAV7UBT6_PLEWA|nr:hypothetical protein NDU88_003181 [Pleurodeles waltl]
MVRGGRPAPSPAPAASRPSAAARASLPNELLQRSLPLQMRKLVHNPTVLCMKGLQKEVRQEHLLDGSSEE